MEKITAEDLKKTRKLEKSIERLQITKNIRKLFPTCYEIPKPVMPSSQGTPDRQFLINGRFIAIEVKRDGEKPRAKQWERIQKIRNAGGIAFYATSWKEVEEELIKEGVLNV